MGKKKKVAAEKQKSAQASQELAGKRSEIAKKKKAIAGDNVPPALRAGGHKHACKNNSKKEEDAKKVDHMSEKLAKVLHNKTGQEAMRKARRIMEEACKKASGKH